MLNGLDMNATNSYLEISGGAKVLSSQRFRLSLGATAAEFTENGIMHEAKEAFLKQALAQAEVTLAWLKRAAPKQEPPRGLRIALEADALVDGLIGKLAPR